MATRDPQREAQNAGNDVRDDDHVVGAPLVGNVPRHEPANDGADVEVREQGVRVRLGHSLGARVRDHVRDRHEHGPLAEEHARAAGGELLDREALDVDERLAPVDLAARVARLEREAHDDAQTKVDECEDADRPAVAHHREQLVQHQRDVDAADGAAARGDSRGERAPPPEPVPEHGDAWVEDHGRGEPAEHGEPEDELVELFANAEDEKRRDPQHRAGHDERAQSVRVENGPRLDAAEVHEEQPQREDPADVRLAVVAELVRLEVLLDRACAVRHAERREDAAERAEHNEPGAPAAVGDRALEVHPGRCWRELLGLVTRVVLLLCRAAVLGLELTRISLHDDGLLTGFFMNVGLFMLAFVHAVFFARAILFVSAKFFMRA